MRVLMFEPSGFGGLSNYTESLCKALSEIGAEVTWLTVSTYPASQRDIGGVRIIRSLKPLSSEGRTLRLRPVWALDRVLEIGNYSFQRNRLAKKIHPDVVHLQYLVPRVEQYMLRGLLKKAPVVLTVHDVEPHIEGPHWSRASLQRVYDLADHLIAHTRVNQRSLMEEFSVPARKLSLIAHGANLGKTVEADAAKKVIGVERDAPVILFFGVIRRNKGLEILIQSLPDVIREIGPCTLVIAGEPPFGEDFSEYERVIERTGVRDHLSVANRFISPEEIPYFFSAADLVVLPYTSFASQSGVLLQAYSYGKPVVVTDVGGLAEAVREDETGEVSHVSPQSVAKSITTMLSDPRRLERAAENARDAIKRKYSWSIVARETLKVYESLIDRND